ncbi:MAG: glycosyltransferase [Fibrobacteres bacterium]|nr:glycosyltransferase [Fibrobacterota bacterium]
MPRPSIRILHIIQSLGIGGMENRIARLAGGLDRGRFAVEVLSFRPPQSGRLELPPGTPHHYFPVPSGLHPLRILRLARFIRAGGYTAVHTHNWSTMFYGITAAWLARRPVILHGEHGLNRSDLAGIPWKRLWAQRILCRMADAIVPVNGVIAAYVCKHWRLAAGIPRVIPNGVDLSRFHAKETRGDSARDPARFEMGMVGRLDEVKDIGCALRALQRLKAAGQAGGMRLTLVGDGPLQAKLADEARAMGVAEMVDFAGARADVPAWYGRFDLYLNTSVYEGMSNTLLEAMACGLPLIASRVPGNAAWLAEGENARFFESGDDAALAAAILALRDDPASRAEMGRRNRAKVEKEYDNRRFLATYAGLYTELSGHAAS